MNLWRILIVVLWLLLTGGGYLFGEIVAFQKRHWEDVGAKLSPMAVQLVHVGDSLIKYSYLWVLVPTILCLVLWNVVGDRRARSDSNE